MVSEDKLWKGIIEDLFMHFMHFFFPDWVHEIDFSRKFEFLDKELDQLFPESQNSNRVADKLVKVYTKQNEESWILIHIEFQGYRDDDFPLRMFTYFYRIFDRYRKPIAALTIFTDDSPTFKPSEFKAACFDTKLTYQYGIFKVLENPPTHFRSTTNPFAIVMETAYYGIKQNKLMDSDLFGLKIDLLRRLLNAGYDKRTIDKITWFIKYYTTFEKPEIQRNFENILTKTKSKMGIEEIIIEEFKKQGLREGFEQGIEQGIEKGIEKGIEQTKHEIVINMAKEGLDPALISRIVKLPEEEIIDILNRLNNQEENK